MSRAFLQLEDLHDFAAAQFGSERRLIRVDRLTGGTKKGVYRLHLDDATTVILYVWAPDESYWPTSSVVPDDPFTDASGSELFAVSHAALTAAGVRVPRLLTMDCEGRHLGTDIALVEDVGSLRLETVMETDPARAAGLLTDLGATLGRMHTTTGPRYGKVAEVQHAEERESTSVQRLAEDVIVDRALLHLDLTAAREERLAEAHGQIAAHVRELRAAVRPRQEYGLVHGELGPDHVFVTPAGEPVLIDFEGLAWFDVEWDHAWIEMRFGDRYPDLNPVALDPDRMALYRYAQVLSLIEGPLRIADTDFPDRDWMLWLAGLNIEKALAAVAPL
ncbi:phosphotransferase family protein [Actinoplanes rectilineatus]|uniref:phosphotransferase family protein n=1 Tax=Actinoplanes rectilineatus TaxID=113571 RepID=UPI0005F2E452|nr:phosphotransferase [Actinoplanes rectilineatus]